ncbi:MAG: c-type cytochrome [Pseudomonadota bacterium]
MRNLNTVLFFLLALLTLPARAQDAGEKMLDAARCYACHQRTDASLGPPWQAIAARHASNDAAQKELTLDVLARKIVSGGGGNWGDVPMVPNQWVSIEEARAMATWILNLPAARN